MPEFGLINMNGRLYDPMMGRMLSPDPDVTYPEVPLSYNRYAYAMNNPVNFVDPNGENPAAIVFFALVGGVINYSAMAVTGQLENPTDFLGAFVTGAVMGAVGYGAGLLAPAGAIPGAVYGAGSGGILGGVSGALNAVVVGGDIGQGFANGALGGAIAGGLMGGFGGYMKARKLGANPWTGKTPTTTQPNSSEDMLATMLRNEANHSSPGLSFEDPPEIAWTVTKNNWAEVIGKTTAKAVGAFSLGGGIAMSMAMQVMYNNLVGPVNLNNSQKPVRDIFHRVKYLALRSEINNLHNIVEPYSQTGMGIGGPYYDRISNVNGYTYKVTVRGYTGYNPDFYKIDQTQVGFTRNLHRFDSIGGTRINGGYYQGFVVRNMQGRNLLSIGASNNEAYANLRYYFSILR